MTEPNTKPVILPDMFGQPLRVDDFVIFMLPNVQRTALSVGRIVGKSQGYLKLKCIENSSFYGTILHKHARQVFRIGEGVRSYLQDWTDAEETIECENNYIEYPHLYENEENEVTYTGPVATGTGYEYKICKPRGRNKKTGEIQNSNSVTMNNRPDLLNNS